MARRLFAGLVVLGLLLLAVAPSRAETLRIAVISDLNGSYGSSEYSPRVDAAVARIIELAPDLVLSTGDMVAGQRTWPKLRERELARMWDAWEARVAGPLRAAGLPLAATPGNHDASAYAGFELEREIYARRWSAVPPPGLIEGGVFPFAYAFSFRDVLFISLDATTVGALPDDQMAWLADLLDRSAGRYRAEIVFSHLPLWPFAIGREDGIIGDLALAALLERTGVDLHLSGHHHAFYPGVAEGVLSVSQACLGGGARALIGTNDRAPRSFTMVEITDDGRIEVYALAAPDYRERIDLATLPESIVTDLGTMVRMDLAPQEQ